MSKEIPKQIAWYGNGDGAFRIVPEPPKSEIKREHWNPAPVNEDTGTLIDWIAALCPSEQHEPASPPPGEATTAAN